ncbi:MAG: hypothetical protein ACJ8C4_13945 [Gemmataceae bacterium]
MFLRDRFNLCLSLFAALLGVAAILPSMARADVEDRLFDFTDAYYLANGVNPAAIGGRRQADGVLGEEDTAMFAIQRNVRALLTLPAYNQSGATEYFTVLGGLSADSFTNNTAGRKARQIADKYIEYIFPQQNTDPVGLGAFRQSVLLDMRDGYFSNNPLGLWLHVWVNYTPKAFNTAEGKKELADLAKRNGVGADGTPIIRTVGEVDKLFQKGLVTKKSRDLQDPLRYAICPVIEDPTDGGIEDDQFLAYPRRADGSPVEPAMLQNFLSLQLTGDWHN